MNRKTIQRDAFGLEEGNRYFDRNEKNRIDASPIGNFLAQRIVHHLEPGANFKILEIGCSSGANLASLRNIASVDCFGIDPSEAAIRAGSQRYPDFDLRVGTADKLPYDDGSMDIIWFAFCLYLVDRALLHRAIAEADRVVKEGGWVVIHDFDPDAPCVRPYRHYPGLKSYKMNYAALFLADPGYSLVEKTSFSHNDTRWTGDVQERLGLWICRRNVRLGYRVEEE